MPKLMSRPIATIFLFVAMMLTGLNVPLGKYLVAHVPIFLFTFYRFAVCSAVLALLVHREEGPHLRQMSFSQVRDVTGMALFGMLGFMTLMLLGLRQTSAIDAGVITATIPAVVVVLGVIFLGDRPSLPQITAIALAVIGIAIIQIANASGGTSSFIGNFLVAGAVIGESSFVIFSKRLAPPYRPIRLALAANLAGLVLCAPLALSDLSGFELHKITPAIWIVGTWYVLAAGVFSLLLWYRAVPSVDTFMAGIAMSAIPITAFAVSILLLGETVKTSQIVGATLVLTAIALAARARTKPAPL